MISRPLLILLCGSSLAGPVVAGSLDAPAAPDNAASAMYTLTDLYNRLNAGTAGVKRSGVFVEPAAGPTAGTGHTLDQIMAKMPPAIIDTTNGAGLADVLAGKKFWGLTSGVWGLQTGTYVASSTTFPFPVAKTGETGSTGVAWPNPRFTCNPSGNCTIGVGNGTVTDNLTGLVWLQDANCTAISPKTWALAKTAVAALANGTCGLSDGSVAGQWRLPTPKELNSLVHAGFVGPSVPNTAGTGQWIEQTPPAPFTGVKSLIYWSSTHYAPNTSATWYVNFYDGFMGTTIPASYVWPVRGGL